MGVALATGLGQTVERYSHYGPFLAALFANFFATFGDKGQLAVITLATQYDARRVFAGAMSAFAAWSALEVVLGNAITRALDPGLMHVATGALFVLFGLWTLRQVVVELRASDGVGSGGVDPAELIPDRFRSLTGGSGGFLTAFALVAFAEFGDKTQLLTINLGATYPHSLLAVYVGVLLALGVRTGIDAFVGERAERYIPTSYLQGASAAVFLGFGLFELGVIDTLLLVLLVGVAVAFCAGAAVERRYGAAE